MHPASRRRIEVATSWAAARIARLDALEAYEASYALTQEFREWLLSLDDHPEVLEACALMVPAAPQKGRPRRLPPASDDLLEI